MMINLFTLSLTGLKMNRVRNVSGLLWFKSLMSGLLTQIKVECHYFLNLKLPVPHLFTEIDTPIDILCLLGRTIDWNLIHDNNDI